MTHRKSDDELVWDRPEPVSPAGRPAADASAIAAAAFSIADRDGLHAVSVKRVATKLKLQAVALEAYLTSRDDLLDLMLDRAFGEIELPPVAAGNHWRADLRAIAHATQAVAVRHPWLRSLAGTRTPSGPNGLRLNESVLQAVSGLGVDPVQMMQLANTVLAFVYGFVQLEMGHVQRGRDVTEDAAHQARTSRRLLEVAASGDYPHLAELFAQSANLSAGSAFDIGLDIVLDGIGARIENAAAANVEPAAAAHT